MPERPRIVVQHQTAHGLDPERLQSAISDRLPDADVTLAGDEDELVELADQAEVLVGLRFPDAVFDRAENLRWLQAISAGVNHLDLDRLTERGVVVTNASGVHAEPIAEQVVGYLLLFERKLLRGLNQARRREFRHYAGGELAGKTLGIVGVGAIGSRVAELGQAFGMRVIGTKRNPDTAPEAVDEIYPPERTVRVAGQADYLVVTCPLTERTRGLIGDAAFRSMPGEAVLVNVARGAIVDEAALVSALQRGQLRGAALDVFETEPLPRESALWDLENVVITPHMAGSTPRYWDRVADIVAENYGHLVAGEEAAMTNRVD